MAKRCFHLDCKKRCSKGRVAWNKGLPMREEQKLKVSSSRKGKLLGNTNGFKKDHTPWNKGEGAYISGELNPFYGKTHTPETRARISERAKGRKAWNKGLKFPGPKWNTGLTKETDPRVAKAAATRKRRLLAGEIRTGGKANPSRLAWKMIDFLAAAGFEDIAVEERFGPYSVDALLTGEWIAFEADGAYWHQANQTDYAARDEWLLREHGLPVVRLSEEEIRGL